MAGQPCAAAAARGPEAITRAKFVGRWAVTHTLPMRACRRTVRYIKAYHDLDHKTIHLRSQTKDAHV